MNTSTPARIRIRHYMARHGIDPLDERNDLPVSSPCASLVPVSGNPHIATGRVAKRTNVARALSALFAAGKSGR